MMLKRLSGFLFSPAREQYAKSFPLARSVTSAQLVLGAAVETYF